MSDATTPTRPHEGTPLPRPTPLSQPHWDGCREGELRVQRCTACGALEFIPQPVCTACFTEALEWTRVSGRGEVYSFSVVHRPQRPEFRAPYVVAIVALEEGAHVAEDGAHELVVHLHDVEEVLVGDLEGGALSAESPRCIAVARRPA